MILNILMGLIVALAAAFGVSMWAYDRQGDELAGTQQSLLATSAAYKQTRQNLEATTASLEGLAEDRRRITTITKEIIREVPKYIPVGTPALPGGYRLLHDAAASGMQVPAAAGKPAAAPVAAEVAAATLIDNYAACREQDAAYQRLQQWVANQGVKP